MTFKWSKLLFWKNTGKLYDLCPEIRPELEAWSRAIVMDAVVAVFVLLPMLVLYAPCYGLLRGLEWLEKKVPVPLENRLARNRGLVRAIHQKLPPKEIRKRLEDAK